MINRISSFSHSEQNDSNSYINSRPERQTGRRSQDKYESGTEEDEQECDIVALSSFMNGMRIIDEPHSDISIEKLRYDAFIANVSVMAAFYSSKSDEIYDGYNVLSPLISPMLSQLEPIGKLGSGNFGDVRLMRSRFDHRVVALKRIMFHSSHEPWGDFCHSADSEVLLREVRALAKCQDSPYITQYYSCWIEPDWNVLGTAILHAHDSRRRHMEQADEKFAVLKSSDVTESSRPCINDEFDDASSSFLANNNHQNRRVPLWPYSLYITMEPVIGITLADWLRLRNERRIADSNNCPLQSSAFGKEEFAIFEQLLKGLRDVHRNGIIHRDLKPANVLIVTHAAEDVSVLGGQEHRKLPLVKIIDFGLASLDPVLSQRKNKKNFPLNTAISVDNTGIDVSASGRRLTTHGTSEGIDVDVSRYRTSRIGTHTYCAPEILTPSDDTVCPSKNETTMFSLRRVRFAVRSYGRVC
jgi:serine/threonine protein kinase